MSDQKLNINFVGEVEKREVLYNYTLPGYSRKDVTEKAWQEVAARMTMSAAECKEKWRNLRTVFMRKLKRSGTGASRKAYYLEDAMQFCLPFIRTSAPPSSENLPPTPFNSAGDEEKVGNAELLEDNNNASRVHFSIPVDPSLASISQPSSFSSPLGSSVQDSISQQTRQKNDRPIEFTSSSRTNKTTLEKSAADLSAAEYITVKKTRLEAEDAGRGNPQRIDAQQGLKMFLLSLIPELEELSDSQIKLFKRRVFALIDEISNPQHQHQVPTFLTPV